MGKNVELSEKFSHPDYLLSNGAMNRYRRIIWGGARSNRAELRFICKDIRFAGFAYWQGRQ